MRLVAQVVWFSASHSSNTASLDEFFDHTGTLGPECPVSANSGHTRNWRELASFLIDAVVSVYF